MKRVLFPVLLAAIALTMTLAVTADDGVHVEHQVKLRIITDAGEDLELNLGELEVGDTETFFTDAGTPVWVTRTESGFEIQVDGEDDPLIINGFGIGDFDIDVGDIDIDIECDDDEDCDKHVIIKKHIAHDGDFSLISDDTRAEVIAMVKERLAGGADGKAKIAFMSKDGDMQILDGDDDHVWIDADSADHANVKVLHLGGDSAAQRLIDSGALEGLDEAKRQEILDALNDGHEAHKRVVIRTRTDDSDE